MRYYLPLAVFLVFPATLSSQISWRFQADSLYLLNCTKDFEPPPRTFASVRLRSVDTAVIVEVSVRDSDVHFGDDPAHFDHIELWFAEPNFYDMDQECLGLWARTSYLCGDTSFLYLYRNGTDLRGFR